MDTIVIYIVCDKCKKVQEYHGQYSCDFCKTRFSPWNIANQLLRLAKKAKGRVT